MSWLKSISIEATGKDFDVGLDSPGCRSTEVQCNDGESALEHKR